MKSLLGPALLFALIAESTWSVAAGSSDIGRLHSAGGAPSAQLVDEVRTGKTQLSPEAWRSRPVGYSPAIAIALAPNLVLALVIAALLGLGERYRRRIKAARKTLNAIARPTESAPDKKTFTSEEARFHALVENHANALVLFDAEGKILYCNKASKRILGHPTDELMGHRSFDCIHADDQAKVQNALRQSIENPRASITVHAHAIHKDRSHRLLEGVFSNLLDDPDVRAIVNNYQDITETAAAEIAWRESEQRFAKVFRSGPLAMSISSQAEGRYVGQRLRA